MIINNFDQSSTGINIELTCFRDTYRSSENFSESFIHINEYDQYVFSLYGNVDVSDFEKTYKVAESVKEVFTLFLDFIMSEGRTLRDVIEMIGFLDQYDDVIPLRKCSMPVLLHAIKEYLVDDDYHTFMIKHFEPDWFEVETRGYCQGDYATVIIPYSVLRAYGVDVTQENADSFEPMIHHLFWGAPVYCSITIDGSEFNFLDHIHEPYEYDKEDMIELADQHLLVNFPEEIKSYIRSFLIENLPEYPDYI